MGTISENDFIRAYDDHADGIFRFCAFRVGDREKAKDLMQDTFTRTWAYIAAGNKIENLQAFLYKTARNLSTNELVRSKAYSLEEMQDVSGYDPEDTHEASPEDLSEASLLQDHLQELDLQYQEVLALRYMNGLSVQEVAEILGLTPNAISVRIHRAIQALKQRMHL